MNDATAPAGLSEAQRAVHDAIAGGPRGGASPFPLQNPDGSLVGPFGLMVRFPVLGAPLQELGAVLRYRTRMSARVREIVILTVARAADSAFERYAHTAVARTSGLSDAEISDLRTGRFVCTDPIESAAAQLAEDLTAHANPPAQGSGLAAELVAEVVTTVGYYRLLAQLMSRFGIGAPEGEDDA
ncbi:carboxymuconolactone decarboxylase family protein [Microbacterium sp. 22303]|uniref:carboxymuconolactone decarboxylase family protein n=1 Tax=Microbacterium sp. 22303 TaxID=3453905 RepID=UPI003F87C8DB